MENEITRILAPASLGRQLSRRSLLQMGTGAAGIGVLLAACGSSDKGETAAGTATTAAGAAPATDAAAPAGKASGTVSLYTWGDYHAPDLVDGAPDGIGVSMNVQYYASNEELIAKLEATKGNSGYDLVVPTGPYLPQLISKELLLKLDKSKIPNWDKIDPTYLAKSWDPKNEWAVPRDWGSTGFLYDSSKINRELKDWKDFLDATTKEFKGDNSWLDTSDNVLGPFFWANGISWNTEKQEDLDAAEKALVALAPNIKAFDSYPSTKIAEGAYGMSAAWNGDARQAFVRIKDAGGDPEPWKWVLGGPRTEIWMDHYAIPADAKNIDGAYAWINWMLNPEQAFTDLSYIGYNMTVAGTQPMAEAAKLARLDMIYFTPEELARMDEGVVNTAQDRKVEIYNNVKAAAGA
jgi:spermidine/putrescine transport system substrate-binding protein